jgi:hypothetical protein
MKTHNPQNERIKRAYFTYLAEAKGFSEATLDAVAKALNRFETYTKFRDFKAFQIEQAKGFKASLADQTSARTKDRLSKAIPEPRPRECADEVFELRRRCRTPAGGDHPRAWHGRATCTIKLRHDLTVKTY